MFSIEPTGLYTRTELAEMLGPMGIDVDGWLAKIRPARRFRLAYFGEDLLEAIRRTPTLGAEGEAGAAMTLPQARNRGERRSRGCSGDPLDPLKQLMRRDNDRLPR